MVKAKVPLQIKILVNNFIILLVIGYIAGILLHEQERIREIEMESRDIREIAKNINKVHRSITELATQGEGVLGWDDKDSRAYRSKRLNTDSLLLTLRRECVRFVRPEQVDTLRMLLAAKEMHLLRIMQSFRQRVAMDSLIVQQLPTVVKSASKPRIEIRRKKASRDFSARRTRYGYIRRRETCAR